MSSSKLKTGAPIRRGFRYQDLTALKFALELYIDKVKFEMCLENKDAGSLDDITIMFEDKFEAYQVKSAVDPNSIYTVADFTNPQKGVFLKKFSDSWHTLKQNLPSKPLFVMLLTNRQLSDELLFLIDDSGFLIEEFIDGRKRGRPREIRQSFLEATQLLTRALFIVHYYNFML